MAKLPSRMAACAVACALLAGCASSTYRVRHRALLVQELHEGRPVLRRDDRTFDGAPIGGGLAEAVAGVPEAEEMAVASSNSMIAFLLSYLGGAVALAGGTAALGVGLQEGEGDGRALQLGGSTLIVAGAIGLGASFWFATQSAALRVDAINAYNDAVIDRLRRQLSVLPPPAQPSSLPEPATPGA